MKRNILIGGAWPYANGSLHIGHIAGLLPGDVCSGWGGNSSSSLSSSSASSSFLFLLFF